MILSLQYKTIFLCLMWKKQLLELFLLLIATSILSVKSSQSFLVQQQRLFSKQLELLAYLILALTSSSATFVLTLQSLTLASDFNRPPFHLSSWQKAHPYHDKYMNQLFCGAGYDGAEQNQMVEQEERTV